MLGSLFEVIIYARDMQRLVAFYRDVLELPVTYPAGLADYGAEHWVALDAGGVTLALHSGGEGATGTPPRFGFRVADVELTLATLLARGARCGEVRSPAPGVRVVDCIDPEGHGFFIEQHGG